MNKVSKEFLDCSSAVYNYIVNNYDEVKTKVLLELKEKGKITCNAKIIEATYYNNNSIGFAIRYWDTFEEVGNEDTMRKTYISVNCTAHRNVKIFFSAKEE